MNILIVIGAPIAVAVVGVLVYASTKPDTFHVERRVGQGEISIREALPRTSWYLIMYLSQQRRFKAFPSF